MRKFYMLIVAVIASSSSFIIHLISAEWLPEWVSNQMHGIAIQPSWSVKYVAMITSIEYGVAAIILYRLAREKLIKYGLLKTILIFSILLTAIHGAFIRQPFMDFVVGNPFQVVLIQNCFKWLVWILMSVVVVTGYEFIANNSNTQS